MEEKANIDLEEESRSKLDYALAKIEELGKIRERVLHGRASGVFHEQQVRNALSAIDLVERNARNILYIARQVTEELKLEARAGADETKSSGLGQLVGSLVKTVGSTATLATDAVDLVAKSAVPITKSALTTSAKVISATSTAVSDTSKALLGCSSNMGKTINNTTKSACGTMVQQTANLAGTINRGVSNILGKTLKGSSNLINSVLNPQPSSGKTGLNQLTTQVGNAVNGLLKQSANSASAMTNSILSSVGALGSTSAATIGNMVAIASSMATGLVGGAANSIIDGVFGKGTASGGGGSDGGLVGGLFGAATSAISTGTSAVGAVSNLVGGMAGSLGNLAGNLLGGAAEVAGNLASSTIGAVGDMLGTASQVGGNLLNTASSVAGSLVNTATDIGGSLLGAVGDIAGGVFGSDGNLVGDLAQGLTSLASDAMGAAGDLTTGVLGTASELAGGMLDAAADMATSVLDGVSGLVDGLLGDGAEQAQNATEAAENGMNGMSNEAKNMQNEYDQTTWNGNKPPEQSGQQSAENGQSQTNQNETKPKIDQVATVTPNYQLAKKDDGLTILDVNDKSRFQGFGWNVDPAKFEKRGFAMLLHDGDQQYFNPYTVDTGDWTMFSFRPCDTTGQNSYPQIAITPSSFRALTQLDDMLNSIPFVVVKEYFFKNHASTVDNFISKITGALQVAKNNFKAAQNAKENSNSDTFVEAIKKSGQSIVESIAKTFEDINIKDAVITIPYILYMELRKRVYGNTYVFPYIVDGNTAINQSSNDSEWGNGEDAGMGIGQMVKNVINSGVNAIGGLAMGLTGSQARPTNLFPAPTWKGPGSEKVSFQFDIILVNDNFITARNNYMCVNTIIHNNRWMQKSILAFPGALYELWLPTGQRHLMCTGDFRLFPVGLNRTPPMGFFEGISKSGATYTIGANIEVKESENIVPPSKSFHNESEVIPDAYKLQMKFTSCLANNMNTSVFQYYVKMTPYENYKSLKGGTETTRENQEKIGKKLPDYQYNAAAEYLENEEKKKDGGDSTEGKDGKETQGVQLRTGKWMVIPEDDTHDEEVEQAVKELVEKFDESTYNKKLGKLNSQNGEKTITSRETLQIIRKSQRMTRELNAFLERLYNAPQTNLWFKQFQDEEIYTTIEPDYRQILKRKYGEEMRKIQELDVEINEVQKSMSEIDLELSEVVDLEARTPMLARKSQAMSKMAELKKTREEVQDEIIKIDVDLIQDAFDQQDKALSVGTRKIPPTIFEQVWNEKIMNAYEKDKLRYLTSEERARYFSEKIRDLKKIDKYGVLNHPDWFFRVVVLDFVNQELQRLFYWFKNCSWDDFDTVYKIVRKMRLLHLDVESVVSERDFDLNTTNLFQISDDDAKGFTKIDELLNGNTLYDLFNGQVKLNFVDYDQESAQTQNGEEKEIDSELVVERESWKKSGDQLKVRQDVINRVWGSEQNLTKAAYDRINENLDEIVHIDGFDGTLRELKDDIIRLKIKGNDDEVLKVKLGQFTGAVRTVKEGLVIEQMQKMNLIAVQEISEMDDSVNAKVVKGS